MDRAEARDKYNRHKNSAKQRGIEFDLSFDEWLEIWGDRLSQRGKAAHQFQMCRTRDEGAYRSGNVRIATAAENHSEAGDTRRRRNLIQDWTFDGEDRTDLRDWVHDRHAPFQNPMHVLMDKQAQELDEL